MKDGKLTEKEIETLKNMQEFARKYQNKETSIELNSFATAVDTGISYVLSEDDEDDD